MERIVLHVDFDYFFAQIEEVENSKLKGKPIVVCVYSGRDKTSGAVSTANYVAREFGVRSGIPIKYAMNKLKDEDAAFLPIRKEHYEEISQKIMNKLSKFSKKQEKASIDECYLEIDSDYKTARETAVEIKNEILESFKLTCSIGIGPNKLISKIASDYEKPNGLTVIRSKDVENFLSPLKVKKIPGIGPKKEEQLGEVGVKTIGDLRKIQRSKLIEIFGKKNGEKFFKYSRGDDNSELETNKKQKQIGKIGTLKENTKDVKEILNQSRDLIKELDDEIQKRNVSFGSIGVIIIDEKLQTHTKSKTLEKQYKDISQLIEQIDYLFEELIKESKINIRRIGVKVEKIGEKKGQKKLFEF